MDKKRNAILTIGVIGFLILFFSVADILIGDRTFSQSENRVLATRPELTPESVLQGEFAKDYETYVTDQFVGRDKWIGLKTLSDMSLQKREINGVYLGKDDYLIEHHESESVTSETEDAKLELLEKLVRKWNAKVMLVPTADNILTDKLPDHADYYDQTVLLAKVKDLVGEENYVDVYSILQEHAEEEIYYRTDHHWTSLGAYYGYRAWLETMEEEPIILEVDRREAVTEEFLGTLHSRINLPMQGEEIQYYYDTERRPVQVTYEDGRVTDSFYEESHLETKNKYGYFLDDNHAFLEIKTSRPNDKTLFVIKDSYANCVVPLMAQHYEKVYVLDLRYFNGRLFSFMEQYAKEGEMDVLVLYNCVHFLEEFQYVE